MLFSETIQEFGFDCRARKLSDKTISHYRKQLKYLQRYNNTLFGKTSEEGVVLQEPPTVVGTAAWMGQYAF